MLRIRPICFRCDDFRAEPGHEEPVPKVGFLVENVRSLAACRQDSGSRPIHLHKVKARRGVLFISYIASRNGAPFVLLRFLKWFKHNSTRPFATLLANGGALSDEFELAAETQVASQGLWHPDRAPARLLRNAGLEPLRKRIEAWDVRRLLRNCRPALIYVNSAANDNVRLLHLLDLKVPILTHVHELEALQIRQAGTAMPEILSRTQRFIACSAAVKQNLVGQGVAADRVDVVHEAISVAELRPERSRSEILQQLGFPDDARLVVGCGVMGMHKGTDLFMQVARMVCQRDAGAHFAWVGDAQPWDLWQHRRDAAALGLTDRVRFVPETSKPADYQSAADVFVLTSREDPFPLVCLEAAALGKPIVCFADAGGMPEFVEDDCGFVVPYLDVAAFADRVICLIGSPSLRAKMGAAAREKVKRHDISVSAPRIAALIERMIASGGG